MSCHPNRIVRITYPKNCCPEVNDSQQLLYNGPALACVDVQTNQTFNDAIKEIDTLICNTLNSLTTTTSTTTQFVPSSMCFSFDGESPGGPYICTLEPAGGLYNSKLYYIVLEPDCTTPLNLGDGILHVYFNTAPGLYQNKWVFGLLGDPLRINQYLDLNVAPDYPIGISGSFDTQPPTNSGTWKGGNDENPQWFITSSILECPTPTNICFTHTGEGFPVVSCIVSPEPGLVNGKLYYKAVEDDCVTPFNNYYVWFSTSAPYINQWVMSPLNNTTNANSYLPVSSSANYPIGNWTIINTSENFVSNSALNC